MYKFTEINPCDLDMVEYFHTILFMTLSENFLPKNFSIRHSVIL